MSHRPLRSQRWFGANDLAGFIHRASLHAEGISRAALDGRPIVGICNSWSELVNCNLHLRGLAEAVKRGVLQAGGLPLEFPTISLGENLMKPTHDALPQPHVDGRGGDASAPIRWTPWCCSAAATRRCRRS